MQALRFVSHAIEHADALADEADDLGQHRLASRLRRMSGQLGSSLDDALGAAEAIEATRRRRAEAHAHLSSIYAESSVRLGTALIPPAAAARLPGALLDVAERARARARSLLAVADREVLDRDRLRCVRGDLEEALVRYEGAVDTYLNASARAIATKDHAVRHSQLVRQRLERAKLHLLRAAPVGGDAWQRIKRRAVRTKRARWLDEPGTFAAQVEPLFSDDRTAAGADARGAGGTVEEPPRAVCSGSAA